MTDHNATSDLNNQTAFKDCAYGDRDKLAQRFTQYLDHRNTTKGAYVANLNGAWGTGKTFFIDNWCHQLKENNQLAIKIDAWESDYLKDPLAIIVAELLEQTKNQSGLIDFAEKDVQVIKYGLRLVKNAAPTILMALGKHFLGDEWKDILQELGSNLKDHSNELTEPDSKKLGDFGKEVFATHTKHKEFVIEFKKSFVQLLKITNEALISENNKNNVDIDKVKTYIFIDELDRCRPTYAIEMLETVKHLFNIPNLVFVLSTDTGQLEHSIKAVYGEGFDAREYLSRFFEQRLLLPTPDHFTFLKSKNSFESLGLNENSQHLFPAIDSKEKVSAVLAMFCELNQISLRRTLQFADKLEATLLDFIFDDGNKVNSINLFELVASLISRELYPIHSQELFWKNLYIDNQHIREKADNLQEKLLPMNKVEIYSNLITTMLDWSEEVLNYNDADNNSIGYHRSPYRDKFNTHLSNSSKQTINTLNNKTFKDFTNSEAWKHWNNEKKQNYRKLFNKKEIDTLVTLSSMQLFLDDETDNEINNISVNFNM